MVIVLAVLVVKNLMTVISFLDAKTEKNQETDLNLCFFFCIVCRFIYFLLFLIILQKKLFVFISSYLFLLIFSAFLLVVSSLMVLQQLNTLVNFATVFAGFLVVDMNLSLKGRHQSRFFF